MGWDFEVERGGTLADAARGIVVGAVAWAVVSVVFTRVWNGHTSEVSAHTQHNQPLGVSLMT